MGFEVFISFKRNRIGGGGVTRDYYLAKDLYETLSNLGIKTFFSEKDISTDVFINQINQALKEARVLVVVGTSCENMESQYVQYEWGSFQNEILNGNKRGCLIYTYLEGLDPRQIPYSLRRQDSFTSEQKDKLVGRIYHNVRHTNLTVPVPPPPIPKDVTISKKTLLGVALTVLAVAAVVTFMTFLLKGGGNTGGGTASGVGGEASYEDAGTDGGGNTSPVSYASEETTEAWYEGQKVTMGTYPPNSSYSESISWTVLEVNGSQALVISDELLDFVQFSRSGSETSWESSYLRTWMNGTFYDKAFTGSEKSRIVSKTIDNPKNSKYAKYDKLGGSSTTDKIFALSAEEAGYYFRTNASRTGYTSDYAHSMGYDTNGRNHYWWLRTSGFSNKRAARVSGKGEIDLYGREVNYEYIAVRPAMWITH